MSRAAIAKDLVAAQAAEGDTAAADSTAALLRDQTRVLSTWIWRDTACSEIANGAARSETSSGPLRDEQRRALQALQDASADRVRERGEHAIELGVCEPVWVCEAAFRVQGSLRSAGGAPGPASHCTLNIQRQG